MRRAAHDASRSNSAISTSTRRQPCALASSSISGATASPISSGNCTPRDASSIRSSTGCSSANAATIFSAASRENCSTTSRDGTRSPGPSSLIQLCGRFGPVTTRLPGAKSPIWSPTKNLPREP
ncbi:hypothetical protein DP42_4228 [Burkholderia pseudomallei]|nr:hypothetical protein DP42_4228 [Burkholderia pseudomallei]